MKLLFTKLIVGINKKGIERKHKDFINTLIAKNIIVLKEQDMLFLNNDYVVGTIDVARNGTGFLNPLNSNNKKDILIEKNHLEGAKKGDLAIAKKQLSRSKLKAKVILVLQNAFKYSIVYLRKTVNSIGAYNIITNTQVSVVASQKSLRLLPKDCLLKIDNSTSSIVEVLGVMSDASVDEKISLCLYDKKEEFSKQSQTEAKSFGNIVDKSMYPDRIDFSHLPFCTIDPIDAKDHDDAIYYDKKENILYVAIADVSEYVNDFGSLDKDAFERSFSIYFPHKSIPMLPRDLSENICSLREKEDRLAFVCKVTFDDNFEVAKEEFIEAIINSKKKYDYDFIDKLLSKKIEGNSEDKEVLSYLFELFNITKVLRERRLKIGFTFRSDEIRMSLDKNMCLHKVNVEKETPSHSLIEECMLLANKAAANKIGKEGIFRTHESPNVSKIEEMLVDLHTIGINVRYKENLHSLILDIQKKADEVGLLAFVDKLLIQSQKRARYAYKNEGHFGLGFDNYSHFTSPIRRYPDLVLHRILKSIIRDNKKRYKYIMSQIEFICEQTSTLERESAKVAWDFEDRKFARWANDNIGKEIEGIIVDTKKSPILKMEKPFAGARVFLNTFANDISLFDNVKAKICDVDMFTAKIYADDLSVQ